jgi:hypothetical protein
LRSLDGLTSQENKTEIPTFESSARTEVASEDIKPPVQVD